MSAGTATAPKLPEAPKRRASGLTIEWDLWEQGGEVLVGSDDVGLGSWPGPAAVHARSWVFMDRLPWSGVEGFSTCLPLESQGTLSA